jgi:hypothetical protein
VTAVYQTDHPPVWSDIARIVNGDIPPKRHRNQALSLEEKLFILWASSRDWTNYAIAMKLHAKPLTVARYREAIFQNPSLILALPLTKQVSHRQWLCRLCGETRPSYFRVARHILAHVLPDVLVRAISLVGLREPL